MHPKTQTYIDLAQSAARQITSNYRSWTGFLTTASRLYKYSYSDQLLIHVQRPEATACAEYDLWNNVMHRYVRRGAKGIALLDVHAGQVGLRYVFDVADTGTRQQSRTPFVWSVDEHNSLAISALLEHEYAASSEHGLSHQLDEIARTQAKSYWQDHRYDVLRIVDDSFLAGYDEHAVEASFRRAVSTSVSYALHARCGFDVDSHFEHADFLNVFDWNTPDAIAVLGTAISQISGQVLRQIEQLAKRMERSLENDRTDLHPDGRLSIPEPDRSPAAAPEQVRADAGEVPSGATSDPLSDDAPERHTDQPPAGDQRDGEPPHGADDDRIDQAERRDGNPESPRSPGLDAADEQPESAGRGDPAGGNDLQLNFFDGSFIPTEAEQIASIDQAESAHAPFAFSVAQEDIDHILRTGSNTADHRMMLVSEFSKEKPIAEQADFLRRIYHGGYGIATEHGRIAVWYAEDGIRLAPGGTARYTRTAQVLTWTDAAKRIGELLDAGTFATNVEVAAAPGHERYRLAQALDYIAGDLSEEAREQSFLSALRELNAGGYPDWNRQTEAALADPEKRSMITAEFRTFLEAYRHQPDLMRFRYPHMEEILVRLDELSLPRRAYASPMQEIPVVSAFITEDELHAALSGGSSMAGGKGRIHDYFIQPHTPTEYADFLKNEYGIGGRSHALSGADHSGVSYDSKGIRFQKQGCPDVPLTWMQAAKTIQTLIRQDRYWTAEETAQRDEIRDMHEEAPEQPVFIPIDGEWTEFPSVAEAEGASYEEFKAASQRDAQNFRITDNDLGTGGAKAKFQANVAAIRLLKHLEAEGLQALPDQQEILSRYVGGGGIPDVFDPSKTNWSKECAELKSLLTPEEYESARGSVLNAHYTSPTVIRAIYDAVERMGFTTGNILEPAMGVGNFFGMLPDSMRDSRLYGVELDSISGRIARQLYPKADITVAGFETTDRRDFFDLAIGNVPFGNYQVNDRAYNRLGFSIHNYFFAKALDQVRPGGVIAFVTSRYTMDQQSPEVRKYLAERAELLGAIRLPNNAFRANAGTDVVSDILFLQKRNRPIAIEPDWVHLGKNDAGFTINSYFVEHPEMMLGVPASTSTQYGREDFTLLPIEGADLSELLASAVQNIHGTYVEATLPELAEGEEIHDSIPADPSVKNYAYTIVDGQVYFRENSVMVRPDLNATAQARIRGMVALRDCVHALMDAQLADAPDGDIHALQAELNQQYDAFTAQYGLINSRANALAFSDDSSYYLLCSLEILDDQQQLKRKADMFTKRTIRQHQAATHVDTAVEALAVSISEKAGVDLPYMAQLTGKSEETLAQELTGVIFPLPEEPQHFVTADEYLSGNVRQKLRDARVAAQADARFVPNVTALEQAQPRDLEASEIDVRLGATWVSKDYIQQFMQETFSTPFHLKRHIQVNFSSYTAEWHISGKSALSSTNVAAYVTFGTQRASAYAILEDTLNLRDVRIYDTVQDADGKEKRVLNQKETTLAQQKQQAIKDAFRDWVWRDAERRHDLVREYNERFNSTRPREFDGSHIAFAGMNPEITLREHQRNAVAHILYGGNTLLAHEVGAGKTFEMVAAVMESKRLGLCQKAMFVVPTT